MRCRGYLNLFLGNPWMAKKDIDEEGESFLADIGNTASN